MIKHLLAILIPAILGLIFGTIFYLNIGKDKNIQDETRK